MSIERVKTVAGTIKRLTNSIAVDSYGDVIDFITSGKIIERSEAGLNTHCGRYEYACTPAAWKQVTERLLKGCEIIQKHRGGIIFDGDKFFIKYYSSSNVTTATIYSDSRSVIEETADYIAKEINVIRTTINWIYDQQGNTIVVPLQTDKLPLTEMYPFLNGEQLKDYYQRYLDSSASVLLLYGPPGTGKTTFIKGLLDYSQYSATVAYDPALLSRDSIFAEFIEGDTSILVLEDSDTFLQSREDGNNIMQKFLNVSDGLVTMKNKKMIFSTNLPSINNIDTALLRPGRCFQTINFRKLHVDEATSLAKKMNVELKDTENKDEWTVAEILNPGFDTSTSSSVTKKHSIGFINTEE